MQPDPPDSPDTPPEIFELTETPTQPDLARFKCPSCSDANGIPTGEVVSEEWNMQGHLHKMTRRKCDWCQGNKWLSREQLARWGAAMKAPREP
jgi:hypothetical protein